MDNFPSTSSPVWLIRPAPQIIIITMDNLAHIARSTNCSEHSRNENLKKSYNVMQEIKDEPDSEDSVASAVTRACRICLTMDVKMYDLTDHRLGEVYHQITGIKRFDEHKLPQKFCWECAARLMSVYKLSQKALESHKLLTGVLQISAYLKIKDVRSISKTCNKLQSNLVQRLQYEMHDCGVCISLKRAKNEAEICIKREPLEECAADPLTTEPPALIAEDAQTGDCYEVAGRSTNCSEHFRNENLEESYNVLQEIKDEPDSEESEASAVTRACRICLTMDAKMYDRTDHRLGEVYHQITGIKCVDEHKLPQKFCWECAARLVSGYKLSQKALESHKLLTGVLQTSAYLKIKDVRSISKTCNKLQSNLVQRVRYETHDCGVCISLKRAKNEAENCIKREPLEECAADPLTTDPPALIAEDTQTEDCYEDAASPIERKQDSEIPNEEVLYNNDITKPDYYQMENDVCRSKTTNNVKDFSISTQKQTAQKPYECNECGKCFTLKSSKRRHMRSHTGQKPHKCKECGKCFITSSDLSIHSRIHTGQKPYKCEECGKCFNRISNLNVHRRYHTGEKPYKCEECGKCFNLNSKLYVHRRYHTGEKPYKCEECGKCFSYRGSLSVHRRTHTGEKPYKCEECGIFFSDRSALSFHRSTHTGQKPYKCEECGKCFVQSGRLSIHLRTHTGEKPYKCKECEKCFSQNGALSLHVRSHTGQKPYKCKECGKCFVRSSNLSTHIRTHTGQKPYECNECGKCFTLKSGISRHMRTHTGQKPYKCKECGKCFPLNSSMRIHMRTHTGEKPYKCKECGKCFVTNGNLSSHIRTHTGQNPYKCEECGKCFSHSGNLSVHRRTHTGEKPY